MICPSTPIQGRKDLDAGIDQRRDGRRETRIEPSAAGEGRESCCRANDLDKAEDGGCGACEEVGPAGGMEAWERGRGAAAVGLVGGGREDGLLGDAWG